jgi:hypothetical protein
MRRVGAVLMVFGALWAIGQALARRRTVDDETSDEFELASYLGGASWTSTAASLRRGVVRVCCGGVDLDLRPALLDPLGATLELLPMWGGVNVTVPRGWRVLVVDRSTLGGVDAPRDPARRAPRRCPGAPRLGERPARRGRDPGRGPGHRWASPQRLGDGVGATGDGLTEGAHSSSSGSVQ